MTQSVFAQQTEVQLGEVTVKAKSVIDKVDRKLILPSQQQIKTSTGGIDLLNKLQLPRIIVDVTTDEVSMSGNGEVQLRINGVMVTNAEITALKPEDIVRVEYHDNPGARYGNAGAVIDYITRRNESGGNIKANVMNNLGGPKTFAMDQLAVKFNHKKSEFSANVNYQHIKQDWIRGYDETLVFPDHELHRLEIGEPTTFDKKRIYTNLNYSLLEKDKYFFSAQFRYSDNSFPSTYESRRSKLITSDSDTPLFISDLSTEYTHSPALDLYFQRHLKHNQLLIFNVVGTYLDSKNTRTYQEKREDSVENDINSTVFGDKYSVIVEGIYEKTIGASKLTGGLKHLQAYTDNEYHQGTSVADVSMLQSETNAYAEYQLKAGKWGYLANLTATRFYYTQDNSHIEQYALQPSARITYNPNNNLYFHYNVKLQNHTPSLAYLNDVEQAIDPLQVRRGNPDLKSFQSFNQNFATGYSKGIFGFDALLSYDYEFKPIMESVLYKNGLFVRTYENQKSFQNLGAEITLKLKPWKDYISLSVTPKINRFISDGSNYHHTYNMQEFRVNLDLAYKNYIANFATVTPYRYVYGEQLINSKQSFGVTAGYKKPAWILLLGVSTPVGDGKNENWAALNPVKADVVTRDKTPTFFVKGSFNLNFGKQLKSGMKRTNNSDEDTGIMRGTKE
ncbi:hypothetical protein AGMMS49525_04070 [Bacteroidia bacterium]|nr:hypothetical protein AGMMS49525_04070 [Bacteroidia bacterium]